MVMKKALSYFIQNYMMMLESRRLNAVYDADDWNSLLVIVIYDESCSEGMLFEAAVS
jgi:hypothetical protein